jgi:AraC-like DNA-binding protein
MRTTRLAGLDGPELKDATFAARAFPAHFHDALSLGIVRAGRERLEVSAAQGRCEMDAGPGLVAVIPPRVVHAHRAVDRERWRYQALYVSQDVVGHRRRRLGLADAWLVPGLVADDALHAMLAALHAGAGAREAAVLEIVDRVLVHHAERAGGAAGELSARGAAAMDDAAALLRADLACKLGVDALARRFGLGPYQLVRAFRKRHGLTPSAYLMVARINEARRLLIRRDRVVDVALAVGFYDQSHFVRYFAKYTGLTPDAYRRGVA